VKEGKGRKEEFAGDDDDEMHCLVTADTQDKVDKCVRLINKVIETVSSLHVKLCDRYFWYNSDCRVLLFNQACSVPESQNEQKLNQLRELAQLNGTFRDFENQVSRILIHTCNTQRIKHFSSRFVKTAAIQAIANTTAQSNATSLRV
jgi:splicing factor 1